jgi:serine phosphatase RsbU (regulator of sigma subunit)
LLFSDGLFEAVNTEEEELGERNLRGLVQSTMALHGDALIDAVRKGLSEHVGEVKLQDDICMLLVESKR